MRVRQRVALHLSLDLGLSLCLRLRLCQFGCLRVGHPLLRRSELLFIDPVAFELLEFVLEALESALVRCAPRVEILLALLALDRRIGALTTNMAQAAAERAAETSALGRVGRAALEQMVRVV